MTGGESKPGIGTDATTPLGGVGAGEHTASLAGASTGAPKSPALPRFSVGDLVAGRYKIVRFIAEGGMGEVYEAEDLALAERVALKTIRHDFASDSRAIERFKREIQLARKVTHPNVCRIFDVGFHKGDQGELTFLTMELLEGETLAARIRRKGPFALAEALPVVEQMAAALAAAHQAGVVHRDFKSANVVLVDRKEGVRAVVTDFGLARQPAGGNSEASAGITGAGGIVGSPAYMAPEQVEGGAVTASADVYAFGVVVYEMLTGKVPFQGDSPLAVAVARLREPPTSPRTHAPSLPRSWESAILRCLARKTQDRTASTLDFLVSVGGSTGPLTRPAPRRLRPLLIAAGGVIVAAIAIGIVVKIATAPRIDVDPVIAANGQEDARSPGRRTVAVMGFKSITGRDDTAWMSRALVELFATELEAGEAFRLIPSESVSRTRRSLSLEETESYAADTLDRLKKALGAELVVTGTYLANEGRVRLDLRVQDTATGETVATVAETGSERDLVDLVVRASARVRERLGIGAVSAEMAARTKAALPANTDAARLYAEGLNRLDNFECLAARDLLERAITADPKHAAAHASFGEALDCLGYEEKGLRERERAIELARDLPPRDKMRIEARYYLSKGDHKKAADIFRHLHEEDPSDLDAGDLLVHALSADYATRDEAERLLGELRATPRGRDSVKLDLAEYKLRFVKNDLASALAVAERLERVGRERGERATIAMGLMLRAETLVATARFDEAIVAARASNVENVAVGDRDGVCWANLIIAQALISTGRFEEARLAIDEATAVANELGSMRRVRMALVMRAEMAWRTGDLAGAIAAADERIAVEKSSEKARAGAYFKAGHIRLLAGDLAGAREAWRDASDITHGAEAFEGMTRVLAVADAQLKLLEGDVEGARRAAEKGALPEGNTPSFGDSFFQSMVLAQVALEEGKPQEAEAIVRGLGRLAAPGQSDAIADMGYVDLFLAIALQQQGKIEEARSLVERATATAKRSRHMPLELFATAVSARLESLDKSRLGEVRSALEKAVSRARKAGYKREEFELRLALGEIATRQNAAAGKEILVRLEKDARAAGFGLYVRKAASART